MFDRLIDRSGLNLDFDRFNRWKVLKLRGSKYNNTLKVIIGWENRREWVIESQQEIIKLNR